MDQKISYTSLKNLTEICEKVTGNKIKFKRKSKTSIYDIPYYITDNKKIKKTYKWTPKKNMDEIVKDTYNWLSKNKIQLSKFLMSIVIITGSTGLVGSESVNFFCKKGFEVIGVDNNLRNSFFWSRWFNNMGEKFTFLKK